MDAGVSLVRIVRRAPGCQRSKTLYTSYRRAARTVGRRNQDAGPLRIYWCPPCGGWHITSQTSQPEGADR